MIADLKPYPQYKTSKQEWLGDLPAHWNLLRAKHLFREVDERSITGKEGVAFCIAPNRRDASQPEVGYDVFRQVKYWA